MACIYSNGQVMGSCSSCVDIENAFRNANAIDKYDPLKYTQCTDLYKVDNAPSCYGAPYNKQCVTCGDVINAYKAKNWWFDPRSFSHCQGILNGSYAQSCKDTSFDNQTVRSSCRSGNGRWIYNNIDLRNCNGALWNNNGNLSC